MLSSASTIHEAALNFAVQASLLGFSTTIIPEGTGNVELFSTEMIVDQLMDESRDDFDSRSSSTSGSRRKWREIRDDEDSLQNIVFVTGRNNNGQCLIASEDYGNQISSFVESMKRRVNFSELSDLKPNGELTTYEKNLGLSTDGDSLDLIGYLVGVKIPPRVGGQRFRIKQIVSLENGTMILNDFDSQVYIIGDVGDGIASLNSLTKISLYNDDELMEEKIESIYNGADFAFFITESNQLYAYGQNLQKQLSIVHCTHTEPWKAQRVHPKLFNYERPEKVACGAQHTVLVTEQGNIYFSGRLHNFESHQFILCRISTLTTEFMRNHLILHSVGRSIDFVDSNNGYLVNKSKEYWLWQLMNSKDIYHIVKRWMHSLNEEEQAAYNLAELFEKHDEIPENTNPPLKQNAIPKLESLVKDFETSEVEENISIHDVIELITSTFEARYLRNGNHSSMETLFLRDFAYLIFTEIVSNKHFMTRIIEILSLSLFAHSNTIQEMCCMTKADFGVTILSMRTELILFENQYCFTQRAYQGVHQLVSTFYESFIVSKCNKVYHFPSKGYAAHLLTFSLLDPCSQIGPKGCEPFRNRNDVDIELKRYSFDLDTESTDSSMYLAHETSKLMQFMDTLTETGSVLIGDKLDHFKEMIDNTLSLVELDNLAKICNPLPYPIVIEKSDSIKLYFNVSENRTHGNIVNISKLPEGVILSLDDNTSFVYGSNAYSELGYPSFYTFTTFFKVNETLNKLRPSTIFSEQYSMVLECSKEATKDMDSSYITGISKSNYLNKMLAPFQYHTNTTTGENRTFFFSGDSSGIRSINATSNDTDEEKLIRESEKMVEFNHLSLLKVRYAPDMARYGFDLNVSIGLDNMIVYFSKKTEYNNSWIFMIRKLEKLLGTPRFSDCKFMF